MPWPTTDATNLAFLADNAMREMVLSDEVFLEGGCAGGGFWRCSTVAAPTGRRNLVLFKFLVSRLSLGVK